MKTSLFRLLIFSLSMMTFFSACDSGGDLPDIDGWQPEFAIPLFNAEFGLEDILEQIDGEAPIEVDSSRLIHIIYEGNIFSVKGEDLFGLPGINGPVTDSAGTILTYFPGIGVVHRADFKAGGLSFNLSATDTGQVEMSFEIPDLIRNGNTFQFDTVFDAPGQIQKKLSLVGFSLLTPEAELDYFYSSRLLATGQKVELVGDVSFDSTSFSYVEGILDTLTAGTGVDTVNIEIFEANESAVLNFQDFDLDITFTNSIGLPIRGTMKQLLAITNFGGLRDINSDELKDGIDFAYPSLMEVGEAKQTVVNLNPNNSDLGSIMSDGPAQMVYQVEGTSVPNGDPGFITDSSVFEVGVRLDLPLFLTADKLFIEQKRDFTVDNWEVLNNVEEASFRIQTENGYPVDLNMQLYLMDDNGIIDSVFDDFRPILLAGPVDQDARVTEPGILNFDVELPAARIANLQRTKFILVKLNTNTLNDAQTPVKIFDDYTFVLKMGLKAKVDP